MYSEQTLFNEINKQYLPASKDWKSNTRYKCIIEEELFFEFLKYLF